MASLKEKLQEVILERKLINEDLHPFKGDRALVSKFSAPVNILRIMYAVHMNDKFTMKPNFTTMFKDTLSKKEISALLQKYKTYATLMNECKKKGKKKCGAKMKKKELLKILALMLFEFVKLKEFKTANKVADIFVRANQGELTSQIKKFFKNVAIELLMNDKELTSFDKKELMELRKLSDEKDENENNGDENQQENKVSVAEKVSIEKVKEKIGNKSINELEEMELHTTTKEDFLLKGKIEAENEMEAFKHELELEGLSDEEYVKAKSKLVMKKIGNHNANAKPIVEKIINEMLKEFKKVEMTDKQKKYLVTNVMSILENTIDIENFDEIFDEYLHFVLQKVDGRIMGGVQGLDTDKFSFILDIGEDDLKINMFVLPPKTQDSGISKKVIKDLLITSKVMGIKKIDLHANIGMGGYVWARYGFLPKEGEDGIERLLKTVRNISKSIVEGLKQNTVAGATFDDALNGLIKHFEGTGFDVYLSEAYSKFSQIKNSEFLKEINDGIDEYYDNKVEIYFGDVLRENLVKVGETIGKTFEKGLDLKTMYKDIGNKVFNVKLPTNFSVTIDLSPVLKGLNGWRADDKFDEIVGMIEDELGSDFKIKTKKRSVEITFKVKTNSATIPFKKWATVTGIRGGKSDNELFPAGMVIRKSKNGREYVESVPLALNWEGYLDLTNSERFNIALEYATIKK